MKNENCEELRKQKIEPNQNPKSKIFLGVDGGQSHTEAVVADEFGNILGRGFGGASNHAEYPGGRERLRNAILDSVAEALRNAETSDHGDPKKKPGSSSNLDIILKYYFASANFGMTGGADYKEEIISKIVKSECLIVGHDAPTALFGATAGRPGIVVISGTGSVIFGENAAGETTKIGGLGYLFSDEGSGLWLALQIIRLAIKEQDGLIKSANLEPLVLNFFGCEKIRELTDDFYNGKMPRERLASFAQAAHEAAEKGNVVIQNEIKLGINVLVESVDSAARRLGFQDNFPVAGVGGMFRATLMRKYFAERLKAEIPWAIFAKPRFNPAIGALLLAYRKAEIDTSEALLINLEKNARLSRAKQQ